MKNQKGITLVALILIIVVLLILAGISISFVVNNETETIPAENSIINEIKIEDSYSYDDQDFTEDEEVEVIDVENDVDNNLVEDSSVIGNGVENTVNNNTVANEVTE
jgi:flagellar basal body-associated protein FliL